MTGSQGDLAGGLDISTSAEPLRSFPWGRSCSTVRASSLEVHTDPFIAMTERDGHSPQVGFEWIRVLE